MVIESVKENLCINKLIATKKELVMCEGDMIVPDSKPDILNTICTSGVVCFYKKEIMQDKVRLDGNINTYIMYMADHENDKVRGLTTNLDFSETIQISGAKEGMVCKLFSKLKTIEAKVINGRKIGIKAVIEIEIKIYSNEEVQIINELQNTNDIKMLKNTLNVNSLVGTGETRIYGKDTIKIDNIDNLAEILKTNAVITGRDIKISYNKVLTKAEAEIKIMYLTEDNRINKTIAKIPIVGFIDIENVTENSICDVDYEIRNIVIKPNSVEEHSIYVEIEVGVTCSVFEEKQINLIQDLYSPSQNIEFNKKKINAVTEKRIYKDVKQLREKIKLEGLEGRNIIDVDVTPVIENETRSNNRIVYEGILEMLFTVINKAMQVDTINSKIPFDYSISDIEDTEKINNNVSIEVANQDFVVQDGGIVSANVDLGMSSDSYRSANVDIIDEIQTNGEREKEDYNIIMYIIKKGDTLWEISKKFGSTIEDIVRANGIEDENKISVGQKIFIPMYKHAPMVNYV
ncbi:MAG: DUF3794 domain-containing protein [Clostridia bacterium]|nr:DUF3794 domain-containing protein [Clostridia bacterium]